MQKFQFRLEPVLKLREAREKQAALEQARALEDYNRKLRHLDEARDNLERAMQLDNLVDPFDLYNKLFYCNAMTQEVEKRETMFFHAGKMLQHCRKKLVQVMQEKSVMENLKEKQLNTYKACLARQQQKEIDEMATRFSTRQAGVDHQAY